MTFGLAVSQPQVAEWIRNGRTLTSDDHTSLELYSKNTIYTERNTVLSIPKADRDRDTGRYTIKLTCEAGTFEASANVNVLDVPLKPRNLQLPCSLHGYRQRRMGDSLHHHHT